MLDLLLTGGSVFDGTGTPSRPLEVGILGDRIQLFTRHTAPEARRIVDVSGLYVCPGFVDIHSHSDLALVELPDLHDKIRQGVTTEIVGNCGVSPFPFVSHSLDGNAREFLREIIRPMFRGPWNHPWIDTASYFSRVRASGSDTNVGTLVGHGSLRAAVMGRAVREPTDAELDQMEFLLARAMDQGAVGLSFGLLWPPGRYAMFREMAALAEVVTRYDGIVTCHLRNFLGELLPALVEILAVGSATDVQLEVSHLMAPSREKAEEALELLHRAQEMGTDVGFDQYPYDRGMMLAQRLLPPWMLEGGNPAMLRRLQSAEDRQRALEDIRTGIVGWDNPAKTVGLESVIFVEPSDHPFAGRSLVEVVQQSGRPAAECVFEFLLDTSGDGLMTMRLAAEEALQTFMEDDLGCFGTDGAPRTGFSHPRTFGTYPRVLGHYVREKGVLSWAEAIRKSTSEPATRCRLEQRGVLVDGNFADIVAFDPATIADRGTYRESAPPDGIVHVFVNGVPVVSHGELTEAKPGRVFEAFCEELA